MGKMNAQKKNVVATAGYLGQRKWYKSCPVCNNFGVCGNSTEESAFAMMRHLFAEHGYTRFDIDPTALAVRASGIAPKN